MNISTMSVRARLTAGFGVICLLLLIITGISIMSMNRLNQGVVDLASDKVPKVQASTSILSQVDAIAIALRNMMLNEDKIDRLKQVDAIMKARETTNKGFDFLASAIKSPEGKILLSAMAEQKAKYRAGQNTLLGLINSDKAAESKVFLSAELRPILGAYKAATAAMIEHLNKEIGVAGTVAHETYVQSLSLIHISEPTRPY